MRSADFPFEVDLFGSPITGIASAEHGRLLSITFEDGTVVESSWRHDIAAGGGNPIAERFFNAVAPEVVTRYADEIEATSGWHYDAMAEHGLGKHQLI